MEFLDLMFPTRCLECRKAGKYLCVNCVTKIQQAKQSCVVCNKPAVDGMTHLKCKRKYSLDGAFSLFAWDGVIRKAILKLKYNFAYDSAKELSAVGCQTLIKRFNALPKTPILISVPLHRVRKN